MTDEDTEFECNICYVSAVEPVITLCGHLYCWECIHKWLDTGGGKKACPVCNSDLSEEKLVPLHGKETKNPSPNRGDWEPNTTTITQKLNLPFGFKEEVKLEIDLRKNSIARTKEIGQIIAFVLVLLLFLVLFQM